MVAPNGGEKQPKEWAWLALGVEAARRNDHVRAINVLQQRLSEVGSEHFPEIAVKALLVSYIAVEDFRRAYVLLEAIGYDPLETDLWPKVALLYAVTGRVQEADALIKSHPVTEDSVSVFEAMAVVAEAKGLFKESLEIRKRSYNTTIEEGHAAPDLYLANGYDRLLRFSDARRYYLKALEANPDDAHVMARVGSFLLRRGDLGQAIQLIRKANEVAPEYPSVRLAMAQMLFKNGEFEQCVEKCDHIAYDMKSPAILALRSHALLKIKRYDDAVASAVEALNLNNRSVPANLAYIKYLMTCRKLSVPRAILSYLLTGSVLWGKPPIG